MHAKMIFYRKYKLFWLNSVFLLTFLPIVVIIKTYSLGTLSRSDLAFGTNLATYHTEKCTCYKHLHNIEALSPLKIPVIESIEPTATSRERISVIMYSYMRGGSSFCGEIFNQNPHAFYWFEPLEQFYTTYFGLSLNASAHPLQIKNFPNGNRRYPCDKERDAVLQFLTDILDCRYHALPPLTFKIKSALRKLSHKFTCPGTFHHCAAILNDTCNQGAKQISIKYPMDRHCFINIYDVLSQAAYFDENISTEQENVFWKYAQCHADMGRNFTRICIANGIGVCQERRIQVIKVIRLDVALLEQLLESSRDTYVIYQYRDPRGILASRFANRKRLTTHKFDKEARTLCSNMLQDVNAVLKLNTTYPGRVIFLRFEDIARTPVNESARVYSHLGETLPPEVTSWLRLATSNQNSTNKPFDTVRSDSSQIPLAWQRTLTKKQILISNELCKDFIVQMNYTL